MKNLKYLLVILIAVLMIPSIASAVWWNPFTWFTKKNISTENIQKAQVQTPPVDYATLATKFGGKTTSNLENSYVAQKPKTVDVKPIASKESVEITNYRNQVKNSYLAEIDEFDQYRKIQEILKYAVEDKITDLKDKIASGRGFKMGNPDSAWAVDYLGKGFSLQLEFEEKELAAREYFISWLQNAQKEQEVIVAQLPNITTKEQLDTQLKNLQFYKENLEKLRKSSDSWNEVSSSMQSTMDGVIAGLSSKYSSSTAMTTPIVAPTYPTTFVPLTTSPYKLNCLSSTTFLGEIQTQCY